MTPATAPLFSVLIPVHNREKLIRECVDSVLSQTCSTYEVVVIDDGSTDGTWDVLRSYGDRIKLLRQQNQGPEVARNLGTTVATGQYLALLDSDDLFYPWTLAIYQRLIEKFEFPGLVVGALREFAAGKDAVPLPVVGNEIEVHHYPDYVSKRVSVAVSSSSIVVRRSVFDQAGGLRHSSPTTFHMDTYDSLLRFGVGAKCVIVSDPPTFAYRVHETNAIHNCDRMVADALRVVATERQGRYAGGRARRFERAACIGGMAWCWIRHAARAREFGWSAKLLVASAPMVAAALWKACRVRLGAPAVPIRISFVWEGAH